MSSNGYLDFEQGNRSGEAEDAEGPAWAPLRDNYMLTNSKLKDWDKIPVRLIYLQSLMFLSPYCFFWFQFSYRCNQLHLQGNTTTAEDDNGRMLEGSSSEDDD